MPLPLRQQDRLQTVMAKLEALMDAVRGKDGRVDKDLEEAQRRLQAAAREATGDWR